MSSACVDYVPALCTHRPSLLPIECASEVSGVWFWLWFAKLRSREVAQTCPFRGRRSRNKVSVGEPAEGSLSYPSRTTLRIVAAFCWKWPFAPGARRCLCLGRSVVTPPPVRTISLCAGMQRPPLRAARDTSAARTVPCGRRVRDLPKIKTRVGGYLGMRNDEERSEMRYVVRIAEFSESSNL